MDASILLVGNNDFCTTLLDSIHGWVACTVEVASTPSEAIPLIHAQQPDVLLIQASQSSSLDLCSQLKAQSRLAWIYCILVESGETPVDPVKGLEFDMVALDAGADAYFMRSPSPSPDAASSTQVCFSAVDLQRLASYVKAGLRRVQNHRDLMRTNDLLSTIALSDPLTELNNRRAFEWELPRQIQNAHSRKIPISLLVLDVDFFKAINDNYGHLTGDRALQLISARLKHNLRFCDTPFRYGGEEFVIILNDTDNMEAYLVAQRLCRLIAEQPFSISETLDLTITMSAGTATLLPTDDERGVSLLNRADQNLLRAKSQGRNRVVGHSMDSDRAVPLDGAKHQDLTDEDDEDGDGVGYGHWAAIAEGHRSTLICPAE